MTILKNHKWAAGLGFVFGLIAPIIGIFLGLQVSTMAGNLLVFPLAFLVLLTEVPIGYMSPMLVIAGVLLSGLVWSLIFVTIAWARPSQK